MLGSRVVEDSAGVGADSGVEAVVAAVGLEVEVLGFLADEGLILIVRMDRFTTGRAIQH
jgi:hypothetical protein